MSDVTPVGKTKDQGWEIGVRRTFAADAARVWETLMTQPGLGLWFGDDADFTPKKGVEFHTDTGVVGHVVSVQEDALLRLRWQPQGWVEPSTLQLRVIPTSDKATVSIHHERLVDAVRREEMQKHWSQVLDELRRLIEND